MSESAQRNGGDRVSYSEALRTWAYIGVNSFGGPAAQISVMHRVLVDEKRWVSEARFLHALNYCMLLPGPEAMQLATYVGWLMHRTRGGLTAGLLFVLPGFLSILALSVAYTLCGDVGIVQGLLIGLKAAVLAIVVEAVIRIGKRVLKNRMMFCIAGLSFVAIYFFDVPFPVIIASALAIGFLGDRVRPDVFEVIRPRPAEPETASAGDHTRPSVGRAAGVLATWLPLWFVPVIGLNLWLGESNVLAVQAWFFSKVALVTFGGAYAVLAYVAQQAVDVHGWLKPGEMLTGLGMAETTPGPLIQVVQFVGYMGAYRDPGALHPVTAGLLASVLVTWVTYVPCFLWIFLGAPYVEYVRSKRSLSAALSTITAAVVGVVLNLAVWFAIHTLFRTVDATTWHGVRILTPRWGTVDWAALAIAGVAAVAIFKLHWGVLRTLALAAAMSVAWFLVSSPIAGGGAS